MFNVYSFTSCKMLPLGIVQASLTLHSLNRIIRFAQNATPQYYSNLFGTMFGLIAFF